MLAEIVNVKMGSARLFEILRGIFIREATKLNVVIIFGHTVSSMGLHIKQSI